MRLYVRDMLQVRRLERLLGRPLTDEELSGAIPVRARENGRQIRERVRRYPLSMFYAK